MSSSEKDDMFLDKLTPAAFEKHAEKEYATRWKYNIWIMVNGKKVPLLRTSLLKYHEKASKSAAGSSKGHSARQFHRDEFIQCTKCNKARRFKLQTKEECRIYHDALADRGWTCANLTFETCDDDEERVSRKRLRGCSRLAACKGCLLCVCLGCKLCRFSD